MKMTFGNRFDIANNDFLKLISPKSLSILFLWQRLMTTEMIPTRMTRATIGIETARMTSPDI